MTNRIPEIPQAAAARLVGLMYLLFPVALFSPFYVWPKINVSGDAAQTAINLMAHERLFRIGVVSELFTWVIDIVLILALYVLTKPVNRHLALLATLFRIVETAILCVVTLASLVALLLLSDAEYLRAFETNQLQGMARLALSARAAGYDVGLTFLGLGSTVFSYLLFESRYVPRALSAWGIFSSVLLLAGVLAMIVFPTWRSVLNPGYFVPIFIYEVTLGFWLLLKDARIESRSSPAA